MTARREQCRAETAGFVVVVVCVRVARVWVIVRLAGGVGVDVACVRVERVGSVWGVGVGPCEGVRARGVARVCVVVASVAVCVAVCCSVLQRVAMCCSVSAHGEVARLCAAIAATVIYLSVRTSTAHSCALSLLLVLSRSRCNPLVSFSSSSSSSSKCPCSRAPLPSPHFR